MSRVLKRTKKKILLLLFSFSFFFLVYNKMFLFAWLLAVFLFFYVANYWIRYKIIAQVPNQMIFKERNFDYLIVGDLCDTTKIVPTGKRCLQFLFHDRTLFASLLILKRMYSYLKDGGTVVLVVKENRVHVNQVLLCDYPFLHPVTIKQYHLEFLHKKIKFPLIYSPFSIFQLGRFFNKYKNISEMNCPQTEIYDFCKVRGIKLRFLLLNK